MPGPVGGAAATRAAIRFGDGAALAFPVGHRFGRAADRCPAAAPGLLARQRRQLALVFLAPAIPPERLDHELHPVALLVLVVAEPLEHAQHRFGDAKDLGRREELVKDAGRRAHDRRAAAGRDPESPRRRPAPSAARKPRSLIAVAT